MRNAKLICATALALITATPCAATQLLVNGSFEDITGAAYQSWGGYTFGAGFYALPGWTVDFGNVDVTTNASGWAPASDGFNSLDINGWVAGQISQSFATIVGKTYVVSFDYSRNAAGAPNPATAEVAVGSAVRNVNAPNNTALFGTVGAMQWQSDTFTFVGTGHDTLRLTATVPGNGGVFFDRISVTGAVPEPGVWTLMITGVGTIGWALRRRRYGSLA